MSGTFARHVPLQRLQRRTAVMVTLPPCLPALQVKCLFLVFPQHFLIKETLLQLELQVSARGGKEGKGVLVRPLVRLFINRVSLWWNG